MDNLNDKHILITGGTGSFGKAFTRKVLECFPHIRRLVIFSRDELKQYEMAQHFGTDRYPGIRYFIGDVRDPDRVRRAMEGIDYVIHAAALKQVPSCEFYPMEAIQTNVLGAENVMTAATASKVKKVVLLSTDKAVYPINAMGLSKAMMEKLMTAFELCMLPDFYPSFSAAISLAKLWPLTYFEHHLGTS